MSKYPRYFQNGNVDTAWQEQDVSADAVAAIVNEFTESLKWRLAGALHYLASPIERKLLLALIGSRGDEGGRRLVRFWVGEQNSETRFGYDDDSPVYEVVVDCQKSVGKYRADFIVTWIGQGPGGPSSVSIAVEADGHDFHEKTKKQAEHDKKRDRFFAAQGLALLRFTGSEIHRAPEKCAAEVFEVLKPRLFAEMDRHEAIALAEWRAGK